MNTTRRISCALAVALSAAAGCSGQAGESPVAASPAPRGMATAAASHETAPLPWRVAPESHEADLLRLDAARALLGAAASDTSLSDSQQTTVRILKEDLRESRHALGSALHQLQADLAAQVRTGTIDPIEVQADETLLSDAVQARITQEINSLDGLHATLDASERASAAAEVRSGRGHAEMQTNPGAATLLAERLDRLSCALGLDHDQRQRISALMSEQPSPGPAFRAELEQRFDQVLNTFWNENFNARAAMQMAAPSPAAMVHERLRDATAFLTQLMAILRPDQRETLADTIEKGGWMPGIGDRGAG